ncbi:MAG TPA: diaminopimelate epimerase [Candidatus Binatia bacterium]|nr:diaminopimelate epimerase [Candidatus Binatia bacterium]
MRLPFTKMHGIGNDYVYVNAFETQVPDPPRIARLVSPRRTAIGSDGLILIAPSRVADVRMEMYNADGSRGEMCGNGIRCVAKYAWDHGLARKNPMAIETDCGIKTVVLEVVGGRAEHATVDMGAPTLAPDAIPVAARERLVDAPVEIAGEHLRVTCVSMGNPHCVLFVPSVDDAPVTTLGPRIERDPLFPKRANVEFVELLGAAPCERLRMRVWERGSGETAACGTGACAVAVAAALTGRAGRRVAIDLVGGRLELEWRESDDHVYMSGPAAEVFSGEIDV